MISNEDKALRMHEILWKIARAAEMWHKTSAMGMSNATLNAIYHLHHAVEELRKLEKKLI